MHAHRLKVKRRSKIIHENDDEKRARVATFMSYKAGHKPKTVTEDQGGHYVVIKLSNCLFIYRCPGTAHTYVHITVGNAYTPNKRERRFTKQTFTMLRQQREQKKIRSIPNHQVTGNQNHKMTSPHTC